MKKIYLLLIVMAPMISLASWSQPTATPPLNNTEPPINISKTEQYKRGTIGAYEFCLFKSDGTKITPCLGKSTGATDSFPWVFDGTTGNIKNTNKDGDVNIIDTSNSPTFFDQKLNVQGKVQATGFCIGKSCLDLTDAGTGTTISDTNIWEKILSKYAGGVKSITAGSGISISPTSGVGDVTISSSVFPLTGPAGTSGLDGIAGKDGKYLSCTSAESGKVLKWSGTAWYCGTDNTSGGTSDGVGTPGPRGCTGPQGLKGDRGEQGLTGAAGVNGTNGKDGLPGKDGINGINGKDGVGVPTGCSNGQIAKMIGGVWACGTDNTGTVTSNLPTGCADGQVAKWNTASGSWKCADDKSGDTNGDGIFNYDDLPSGSVAGYCALSTGGSAGGSYFNTNNTVNDGYASAGLSVIAPAVGSGAAGGASCTCKTGWYRITTYGGDSGNSNTYYQCLKK